MSGPFTGQTGPVTEPAPPDLRPGICAALTDELVVRRAEVAAVDARLLTDLDRLIDFATDGGKMLRAQFLCHGFRAGAAAAAAAPHPVGEAVFRAAAALELIQACALLHDDIIDRSDTRRGRPSIHRAVAAAYTADALPTRTARTIPAGAGPPAGADGNAGHLGKSVALLLGDFALAWADDLFVAAAADLDALDRALPLWRAMRTEVLAGQLLDLAVTARPAGDPADQEHDALQVNLFKTAAYTVARPLQLGAALAGGSPAVLSALGGYGRTVGVAFQLRDDQLGVFGDPATTGKPAGGDLLEGKRTVLLARTRAALTGRPAELAELDAALAAATPATVGRLTAMISASGAPDQIEVMIAELTTSGLAALDPAVLDAGSIEVLTALADRATARNS